VKVDWLDTRGGTVEKLIVVGGGYLLGDFVERSERDLFLDAVQIISCGRVILDGEGRERLCCVVKRVVEGGLTDFKGACLISVDALYSLAKLPEKAKPYDATSQEFVLREMLGQRRLYIDFMRTLYRGVGGVSPGDVQIVRYEELGCVSKFSSVGRRKA
jgi:hypothetical protein